MIPTLIDRKKIEFNTVPLLAGLLFFKGKTDESYDLRDSTRVRSVIIH